MSLAALPLLPLSGVRVIEFCSIAAGPFCGMLLADMGADVLKIEPPSGDALRTWPPINDGFSENFASINRNKRSAVLDLKLPEHAEVARRLCAEADVVIENNRPGVMDRLGLGYERLSSLNPKLVYCSISAFGQSGPRASEGGFDLTIQAAAGVMSVTGESEDAPVKCGVPLSDFASGLYGAFAISSALLHARSSGVGACLDIPMFGCTLAISALQTSEYFGTGKAPRRLGSAHPRAAPYQGFQASDAPFMIAAGNDKLWLSVCDVVGLPELKSDPRFQTGSLRATNQKALEAILQHEFSKRPKAEWLAAFDQHGVPCAPINNYAEILDDAHVQATRLVRDMTLPNGRQTKTIAFPMSVSGHEFSVYRASPLLGEHNDAVFAEWLAK